MSYKNDLHFNYHLDDHNHYHRDHDHHHYLYHFNNQKHYHNHTSITTTRVHHLYVYYSKYRTSIKLSVLSVNKNKSYYMDMNHDVSVVDLDR
ncbi:hypothetical protein DPMN_050691 [Dreissena polymorpha]|uniref:Uncharacterized protein n=1 Tax=Dreissena polymorpha TaxID=45954 RepID=A0A9D4CGL8_DREPO|nr:hypothetical protein DPMN_050691 [Dreissena polymorpha]